MNKKVLLTVSLILSIFGANYTFALENSDYFNTNAPQIYEPLQGHAVFVPAGITINALLSCEINSESAVVGQSINAILTEDFIYNGTTIAPVGSVISGNVVSNKKAGWGNRNAQTQIRFTNIRTPYNNVIPISASVFTNDLTGVLKGATAKDSLKDYAGKTIAGAGMGAVSGTIIGAISKSKSVGEGAAYGALLGTAGGIIGGAIEKGESVIIPSNSQINIYFDQPITLNAQ